ncbi:MAG TPA: hypothetical protein VFZ21_23800 [Gemmatimonadaceae bacterium]|jgi:hypothetical protein|nr:hypothetical protein [Gemmatimonadaceae bacterium]
MSTKLSPRVLRAGLIVASASLVAAASARQINRSSPPANADPAPQLVLDWNRFAQQVIVADNGYINPLPATRALAMMHLAMHDAINAAAPRYATYAIGTRDPQADPAIAAVQAAHDVLAAIYPKQNALLQSFLKQYLDDAGLEVRVAKGVALGKRAAADIIAARANDNSMREETYTEGTVPGRYRFVPGFDFVNMPHWRAVTPFALTSPAQFRVKPPPSLASKEYAAAFDEVRRKGGKQSDARTRDESHYAAFWYELSDIGWNRIARVVWREHRQDLWTTARTFALLNAALADSYIAGWDSKLHYDFWRPISAIRLAAEDGNAATLPAPAWEPFLTTPPVQDHPSTHSVLGAAGAVVLAHAFGRDDVAFTFTSLSADSANPARSFRSFSEAARENAESRVRAGIHFRFAIEAGLTLGQEIGRHTVKTLLPPAQPAE